MRRRAIVSVVSVLAVATGLAGACGGGDDPEPESGAKGRIAPGPVSTLFADDDGTTSTSALGATASTGIASGSATTAPPEAPGSATTTTATASPSVQATAALNTYLDGLVSERYGDAMGASTDVPRMMAFVRSLFKTFNESKGGKSTFKYTTRTFSVASVAADRIAFSGRAVLAQTTQSGDRSGTTRVEIKNPVARNAGGWKVADLTLDGKSVSLHRSAKEARHPGAPVTVRLVGALNSGSSTGVIIAFESERGARVQVDQDALKFGATSRVSTVRILAGSYAYFSYARRDDRPTAWQARVTIDGKAALVKIPFD